MKRASEIFKSIRSNGAPMQEMTDTEEQSGSVASATLKEKPNKEPMKKISEQIKNPDIKADKKNRPTTLSQNSAIETEDDLKEDLRKWFDPKHPEGGWKRINSKGEAIGPCAREPGEPKPKCMSNEKRAKLSKKERAAAVASKRKHDPNPERKGEPINVSNFGKGKISEDMEQLDEKNVPTSPEKWAQAKAQAKAKFDVYPSAYANGWAAKKYKEMGGGWKSVNEAKKDEYDEGEYDREGDMAKSDLRSIIANAKRLHDMIGDADNLPEWVQSKITVAEDYISTVANYMTAEMNEETEQLEELSSDLLGRYKKAAGQQASEADKAGDVKKGDKRFSGIVKATKKQFDNDMKKESKDETPPFDPPYKSAKETVTDKSGAKHGPMSTVRHLARQAMKKQSEKMKPMKESLQESRKADIVKEIVKKKKDESKSQKQGQDKFDAEPVMTGEIMKA
jgi:hypothetical protein